MFRTDLSRPVGLALDMGVITPQTSFFDYGCGRGGDVARLNESGIQAAGWDPAHAPGVERVESDVVNLGFVLNVIEEPTERMKALAEAWKLSKQALVITVRPEWELSAVEGRRFRDGVLTRKGTFQKFFSHDEFVALVRHVTHVEPVVVAPGVALAFRDPERANDIRMRVFRRRLSGPRLTATETRFNENREILEPLLDFLDLHGRLPGDGEDPEQWAPIRDRFGSLRAAFGLIKRATGESRWEDARKRAEEDVAVFLALMAFGGRPKWGELSEQLQLDVRALFGSYKQACLVADRLLFSLGDAKLLDEQLRCSPVGKVLPDALYLHISALPATSPVLRLYEGCARVLVGDVPGANVIKLSRVDRRVSYLSYPAFDKDGHPALAESLRIDLQTFSMRHRDYSSSENPPILHRKETLVAEGYDGRDTFARLTRAEEAKGLFDHDGHIGNRRQWQELLADLGLEVRGNRLLRRSNR
jgi:DNA phosphorothioation-associated putative methyltransferase